MSEQTDRRARKKAQTRAHVRAVAHGLFAERGYDAVTIADVARTADVAVQTVFNHFSTKEELFFDGRTPWVHGPADAVRHRTPAQCPLSALIGYLGAFVRDRIEALQDPDHRHHVRLVAGSESLRAHERHLVGECERLLAEALAEAWAQPAHDGLVLEDPGTTAALTAATWLSAIRALLLRQRPAVTSGVDPAVIGDELARQTEQVLDGLAESAEHLLRRLRAAAGQPPARLAC
ncbi:TetR family transcriptional regulator [Blastococcus sp. MG754426]|uniref:TetR/AcrR family transcriptional regulator n=1 Tax=unclassified Blastococcus TaxID=2619396 RepID=UPI001EEFDC92|nr:MULTISPECIES: helix-turn-helix domain-containing protein [unclassified Blastococcus]MCF6508425.1 TetR family transcriptional regulator [Blastococcus sp. MG754426]MCF6514327.1 TetR family transcriptional regulator [Blastococcus sp. MG754427]MCF6737433.1 TetR family transcriptional regulator [Blastococcus sp. KM273129]